MTDLFWNAVLTGTVLSGSAIALTMQNVIQSKTQGVEDDGTKDRDDPNQAFSDAERQKRLIPVTLTIAAWRFYAFVTYYQSLGENTSNEMIGVLALEACLVLGWVYALVLAVLCWYHRLPDQWGWVLNIHLCVFYLAAWTGLSYTLGRILILPNGAPTLEILALFIIWMLNFDLLFVTATTRRGPSKIDKDGRPIQLSETNSLFGKVTFLWTYSIVQLAQIGRQLENDDLPTLQPSHRAQVLFQNIKKSRGMRIMNRLLLINWRTIAVQMTATAVASVLRYAPPYIMNRILVLLTTMEKGETERDQVAMAAGYGYITLLFVFSMTHEWFDMRIYHNGMLSDLGSRGSLFVELYLKALKRRDITSPPKNTSIANSNNTNKDSNNPAEKKNTNSVGSIVNLMSTDTIRIGNFGGMVHEFVRSPVELCVAIALLYQLLGNSCFLGLLILVFTLPLNHYASIMISLSQRGLMQTRDHRVGTTTEIVQGIRQVKFFAWESRWGERIMSQRSEELDQIWKIAVARMIFNIIWQGTPIFVSVISLWSYTIIAGNELTAATAFTALLVFEELRVVLNVLPHCISDAIQVLVSLDRVDVYLDGDELETVDDSDIIEPIRIGMENATVSWTDIQAEKEDFRASSPSSSDKSFVMQNITVEFPIGKLSIICGSTGAGKTLLMMGLLGEAYISNGKLYCPRTSLSEDIAPKDMDSTLSDTNWIAEDSIAYVSQNPWLQNASIMDNILFGLPLDYQRYRSVIEACALVQDLAQYPDGDQTEIGEKGITLSGGQKARVALARAVYSRAKHVLMDDVLSAVDAYTAKHLYENCIMGPLLSERTRILITHHVRLCFNGASNVVWVEKGVIKMWGDPAKLEHSEDFQDVLTHEDTAVEKMEPDLEELDSFNVSTLETISQAPHDLKSKVQRPKVLVEVESRAQGYVKIRLFWKYCVSLGGALYWFMFALAFLSARGFNIAGSLWIKKWTDNLGQTKTVHDPHLSSDDVSYYIQVYAILMFAQLIFSVLRFAVVYVGALRAGRLLFAEMLECILRAPLRFFDTTPVGRILNRFAKDMETIDSNLCNYIVEFFVALINVITVFMFIGIIIPWLIAPFAICLVVYIYLGKLFMNSGLQYRRLESINRSPMFTHFTETIAGVSTIRAFGKSKLFITKMIELVDNNLRPGYNIHVLNRWITSILSIISTLITCIIALMCLWWPEKLSAATAAICMSYSLTFTGQVFDLIRRTTSIQLSFNSVERVVEYTELDQDPPAVVQPRPLSSWPEQGIIEFKDLHVKYAPDLETVLRGVSFKVKPKEKVGIVGRTGSGKSTIALSLFRFVETCQGSILVDDIEITKIGTTDLRSSMSIIPQDPTLFTGTLRSNLDPFNTFQDADIFLALKRVHLLAGENDAETECTGNGNINVFYDLDTPVSRGGLNFSQGQRQLLCLARALLQRRRILVMDEATASVDFKTDEQIQRTISQEFKDCTILCIAHRLLTVVEYDRILVLDQGQVVEFANPYELLRNKDSKFYQICKNSGEFRRLMNMAKLKHQLIDV
ncbi:hypothetical protein INT44_001842 [Umbelopsis vinacea]|uniref:P-loop containing nucleoside triphosphate hydrolase protein n=1 Tax=Umbelopsis vinacea TaxID=44442 RepID=A0A8H7UGT5_9FUNG|nr:hypothetical protein INT44_001842 [Umbelopsis vinacea]